jgi:hypothetical protein
MPCASSIKTAYLIEWLAAHRGDLDAQPEIGRRILTDDHHPAVAHFTAAQRATALRDLGQASVRRIGEAMIRGNGIDNATYNIAANLVTAAFDGPEGLQRRLRARDGSWRGLQVRRYMLADRAEHGDNEATPRALCAVLGGILRADIPGIDRRVIDAARSILLEPSDDAGPPRFTKSGALDSRPAARIRSGFLDAPGERTDVVWAVMVDSPEGEGRRCGDQLEAAAEQIERLLLRMMRI